MKYGDEIPRKIHICRMGGRESRRYCRSVLWRGCGYTWVIIGAGKHRGLHPRLLVTIWFYGMSLSAILPWTMSRLAHTLLSSSGESLLVSRPATSEKGELPPPNPELARE